MTSGFGPYCYFNNGLSFRACDADYVAQDGEVVFQDIPTEEELAAAFSGYQAAIAAQAEAAATLEARRAAVQTSLEALIASLNSTYAITLATSLNVSEASAILLAAGASWDDCLKLKLLYDTINTMGGIKTP